MKKMLTQYLKPYYPRMVVGLVIKFTGTAMDLLLPWTLAYMIDTVIPANQKEDIALWGLFMVGCSILAVVFSVLANRMAARVSSDAIYVIRGDLFRKVMYLSNAQMDQITRPSLISRLTSDTYHVHQMLSRMQRLGVRAPILLLGGIAITMALDPVLAAILLTTIPLLTLVVVTVSRRSIPMFSSLQERVDRFVRLIREDISGIRVIKALSQEDYERRRFDTANKEVVDWERKATVTTAVTNPTMNIFLNLGLVAVILAGAYRVNEGSTEVGKILAFMTYFTIILNALMSISRMFIIVSKAAASSERIIQVLDADCGMEIQETQGIHMIQTAQEQAAKEEVAHVEFDRVSFSYHGGVSHVENISFCLKRGETLGIIGATGSGKSTVVNLLMRFYDVSSGTIRIDRADIRTMEGKELRRRFGAVFQNDVIFEDSILENIQMGRDLSEERVQQALLYAQASEFVGEKGGMEENIDIRGANLSGGQRQRLLIARALAAHPEILVLDDSSSALDYKTDAALRKELKEHYSDTTCIVIAQRISSVMNADHIMVLEDGNVIGYGSHQELMETCGAYREIGSSQMGI